MAEFLISDWKPVRRGALRGFVTATLPSGMIVHEISVFETNGRAWASPPSKLMIDREGHAMLDDAGKRRYSPLIEFTEKATRDRFSDAIIAALRAAHPGALDE